MGSYRKQDVQKHIQPLYWHFSKLSSQSTNFVNFLLKNILTNMQMRIKPPPVMGAVNFEHCIFYPQTKNAAQLPRWAA